MFLVDPDTATLPEADIELPTTKYYYDAHFRPYPAQNLVSSRGVNYHAIDRREGDSNSSRDYPQSGKLEGE